MTAKEEPGYKVMYWVWEGSTARLRLEKRYYGLRFAKRVADGLAKKYLDGVYDGSERHMNFVLVCKGSNAVYEPYGKCREE